MYWPGPTPVTVRNSVFLKYPLIQTAITIRNINVKIPKVWSRTFLIHVPVHAHVYIQLKSAP